MYEAHFALRTRPFLPHRGSESFVRFESLAGHRRQAEDCLRQGAGLVLVTGDHGVGKSAWCADLTASLRAELFPVCLSAAGVSTPADLYTSLLTALGEDARFDSATEGRLGVLQAARGLQPERSGLLLVLDDAQEASSELLQELRVLAAARQQEPPLVRVVLCGTPLIEEQLATPELESVSQCISCHVVLEELTRQESREYVAAKIGQAGGTLDAIFSPDALETVCEAGAGRPKCLNQLCDHSLLLAFVNEQRPVPQSTVVDALDDLKGLALPWNLPYGSPRVTDDQVWNQQVDETPRETDSPELPAAAIELHRRSPGDASTDNWWDDQDQIAVIEVGGGTPVDSIDAERTDPWEPMTPSEEPQQPEAAYEAGVGDIVELLVHDRYAELDRAVESSGDAATVRYPIPDRPAPAPLRQVVAASTCSLDAAVEEQLAADVLELQSEVGLALQIRLPDPVDDDEDPSAWDVILPEPEGWSRLHQDAGRDEEPSRPQSENWGTGHRNHARSQTAAEAAAPLESPASSQQSRPRRYAQLFSRLRWRRAVAAEQRDPTPGLS